jgi:hypothetical protein
MLTGREREACVVRLQVIHPPLPDYSQIPLIHSRRAWEALQLALTPAVISSGTSCPGTMSKTGAISPNLTFCHLPTDDS